MTFSIYCHDAQYHVNKQIKKKVSAMHAYIIVYDDSNKHSIKTYENAMENYCRKDDINCAFGVKMVGSTTTNNKNGDFEKLMKLNQLKNVLSATYFVKKRNIASDHEIVDIICQYYGIDNVNWNNYDYNYSWSMENINGGDVTHDESLQSVKIKDIMIRIYDETKKKKVVFAMFYDFLFFVFFSLIYVIRQKKNVNDFLFFT